MSAIYKTYVVIIQTINQVLTDRTVLNTVNAAFNNLMKVSDERSASATEVSDDVDITDAKNEFIEKCTTVLKERSSNEIYSLGERVAMLYTYMKNTNEKVSDEAIEVIHPIGTGAFKEVLGEDEYATFMNGWQNIIDNNPPSELTMLSIRKEVQETVDKQKKIKEESDKRFALNIRKKVTASQAAMIAKKKLEKAGMVFEEGEGITFIKKKPEPEPAPVVDTTAVETPSGGVAETKDD